MHQEDNFKLNRIMLSPDNPASLWHFVPTWMYDSFAAIPEELLSWDAKELRKEIKPGLTLEALRASFWVEYNNASLNKRKMVLSRIHASICSEDYFYRVVLKRPIYLAWLLTPPEEYARALNAMLIRSTERLYEIINQDFVTIDGNGNPKIDVNIMKLILETHKHIENRTMGTVVQKIEQRNLNVNLSRKVEEMNEDELERSIRELRYREKRIIGELAPEPIDVGAGSSGEGSQS